MILNEAAVEALTDAKTVTGFTLVLVPVRDPCERNGHAARTPEYRLKILLKALVRGYGFRCASVKPTAQPDPADGPDGAAA